MGKSVQDLETRLRVKLAYMRNKIYSLETKCNNMATEHSKAVKAHEPEVESHEQYERRDTSYLALAYRYLQRLKSLNCSFILYFVNIYK